MSDRESLEEVIKSGDRRASLIAIRDFLAHELEGNRCNTCEMSKLRTGDTAALVLRLTTILDQIEELGAQSEEGDEFDKLIARTPDWASAPPDFSSPTDGR